MHPISCIIQPFLSVSPILVMITPPLPGHGLCCLLDWITNILYSLSVLLLCFLVLPSTLGPSLCVNPLAPLGKLGRGYHPSKMRYQNRHIGGNGLLLLLGALCIRSPAFLQSLDGTIACFPRGVHEKNCRLVDKHLQSIRLDMFNKCTWCITTQSVDV